MALGVISDFYGPQDTFAKLLQSQSAASPGIGYEAARLADPFASQRGQYQNALSTLVSNPGEFSSSPFYKFAYDQGLNALQRKGTVRSGNKLAELMRYGQGMASQTYFPQANLLATLSGATTGSPAAAGLAVSGAFERSQNLANLAAANRAAGQQGMGGGGARGGGGGSSFHDDFVRMSLANTYGGGNRSALPSGGNAPLYDYNYGVMQPLSSGGTGYVSSDYGTYNFGSPASGDSYYTPSYSGGYSSGYSPSLADLGFDTSSYSFADSNPWGGGYSIPTSYDYGGYGDYGYGDYGGYGGYDYGYDYGGDYYGGWDEF